MLVYKNIGWLGGIKFIDITENKPIKLRSYNGCMCFQVKDERIGLKTWKENARKIKVNLHNDLPF